MHTNLKRITQFLLVVSLSSMACFVQAAPDIQHWQTKKGARVYFVPAKALPMVDVQVSFAAGSARDPELTGVAELTGDILMSGAQGMDAQTIATKLEAVGAQSGQGVRKDSAFFSLRTLSDPRYFDPAVAVAAALQKPDFPEAELARLKQQMLVALKNADESPEEVANRTFMKAVYGDHPYGRSVTADDVKKIQVSDLKAFFEQYYVAKNAVVAIVGDIDRAGAEALAEQLTDQLPEGQPAAALPVVKPLTSAQTIKVDFPSTQSHIYIGQPGMKRGDDDYFALYLGNHTLGGSGFSSRLMTEIREKRGLVYGVYSYFSPMAELGPFLTALSTKNASAEEASQLVHENIQQFVKDGMTKKEIDGSQQNITGGAPLRTDSNKKLVGYIAMIGFYQLPLDYLARFNDQIMAQTQETVKQAFQRRIHPDKLVTVIVGGSAEK